MHLVNLLSPFSFIEWIILKKSSMYTSSRYKRCVLGSSSTSIRILDKLIFITISLFGCLFIYALLLKFSSAISRPTSVAAQRKVGFSTITSEGHWELLVEFLHYHLKCECICKILCFFSVDHHLPVSILEINFCEE